MTTSLEAEIRLAVSLRQDSPERKEYRNIILGGNGGRFPGCGR